MNVIKTQILLIIFTTTIFISAFLLFAIQPMFTKMILPQLGGAPSVWSVAMVFFQTVLLAGYLYAHLLTKYLAIKWAAFIHIILTSTAIMFLPISASISYGSAPENGQTIWLIGMFLTSVGLPFFAVAANGPLLQAWFARSEHSHAANPYFLYAASNLGSFTALLLFPILFEPLLRIKQQSYAWSFGFVLLVVFIILSAFIVCRPKSVTLKTRQIIDSHSQDERPSLKLILKWIGLSFIPSGLLLAVTTHITTDIAAAPFLWILPLALFLFTFVLVFRDQQILPIVLLERLFPALSCILFMLNIVNIGNFLVQFLFHIGFFFIAALIFHNRLYKLRPHPHYLTSFYLWMSFGGVLGGLFCGLVAPAIFNRVLEYPILISASVIGSALFFKPSQKQIYNQVIPVVLIGLILCFLVNVISSESIKNNNFYIYYGLVVLVVFLLVFYQKAYVLAAAIPMLFLLNDSIQTVVNHRTYERSFFGVHKIDIVENGQFRTLNHGVTLHGAIRTSNADGSPLPDRPKPLTYYHKEGPNAETFRLSGQDKASRQIGIVGLGTGAHACNGVETDKISYFEIDPIVYKIARDENLFRYLSACAPNSHVILGDARLTLANEPKDKFDYLLIDAFSSDAIPTHLLTKEAFALYLGLIKEDGLLAMHISNSHLELESVIAALVKEAGVQAVVKYDINKAPASLESRSSSHVVAISKTSRVLAGLLTDNGWAVLQDKGIVAWSDDYSNVFGALWRRYTR